MVSFLGILNTSITVLNTILPLTDRPFSHLLKKNFIDAVEAGANSTQPLTPGSPGLLAEVYDAIAIVKDAANKTESDYVHLNFILASAAEVEHI